MPALQNLIRTVATLVLGAAFGSAVAADTLKEIRLDYAADAPASLVIRQFGWAEQAFAAQGTTVRWVRTTDGAAALAQLNGGALDFALANGGEALRARIAGQAVKAVYVTAKHAQADAAQRYGFLSTTEGFIAAHAGETEQVVALYERARQWMLANPEAAARLVLEASGQGGYDLSVSRPGPAQVQALKGVAQNADTVAVRQAVDALVDDRPIRAVLLGAAQRTEGATSVAFGF